MRFAGAAQSGFNGVLRSTNDERRDVRGHSERRVSTSPLCVGVRRDYGPLVIGDADLLVALKRLD